MEKSLWNNRDEVSLWRRRLGYEKRDGKERLVRLRDGEIMKDEVSLWRRRLSYERKETRKKG
jgi:hypothetical protein